MNYIIVDKKSVNEYLDKGCGFRPSLLNVLAKKYNMHLNDINKIKCVSVFKKTYHVFIRS